MVMKCFNCNNPRPNAVLFIFINLHYLYKTALCKFYFKNTSIDVNKFMQCINYVPKKQMVNLIKITLPSTHFNTEFGCKRFFIDVISVRNENIIFINSAN